MSESTESHQRIAAYAAKVARLKKLAAKQQGGSKPPIPSPPNPSPKK